MRALLAALLLAGCYNPAYEDCAISCAQSNACPAGLECVAGVCRSSTGPCGGVTDDGGLGAWQFRKKLVLKVSASSTLTDFPVAVRLPSDPDLTSFAQPDGRDIKFTTLDGLQLAHEIERYDSATGELVAWVKVPVVQASPAPELYMLYGNPAARDQQNPTEVWSNGYLGVWHMADPPGTTIADSRDTFDGTKVAANAPSPSDMGILAGAQHFSGTGDFVDVGDSADFVSATLTLEMWVNLEMNTSELRRLFVFPTTSPNPRLFVMYPGLSVPAAPPESLVVAVGPYQISTPSASLKPSTWNHIVIVPGDGTAVMPPVLYINGTRAAIQDLGANIQVQSPSVMFGGDLLTDHSAQGLIDEVRISNVQRDAEWVAATYDSQRQGTTFVGVGPAETNPN